MMTRLKGGQVTDYRKISKLFVGTQGGIYVSPHLLRSILAKSELDKDLVSAVADVLADAAADVPFSTLFTGRFCLCRERGTIDS